MKVNNTINFNSPEIYSTREYKIVHKIDQHATFDSYGVINCDGIKNIKVFPSIDYSSYQVEDYSVIRLQLPPKKGLKKGECAEVRLKFHISSLFEKITTGLLPNYLIKFFYFPAPHFINESNYQLYNATSEIKVKPILGLADSQFKGGFDIFLYFPPGFEKVAGFNSFKKRYDIFNIEGKKAPEKRVKLLWRLRELLKQKDLPEDSLSGIGLGISISGTLTKKYDAEELVDKMSKRIPPGFWTKRVDKSILLSCTAIALSVISIFLTLLFLYLNR